MTWGHARVPSRWTGWVSPQPPVLVVDILPDVGDTGRSRGHAAASRQPKSVRPGSATTTDVEAGGNVRATASGDASITGAKAHTGMSLPRPGPRTRTPTKGLTGTTAGAHSDIIGAAPVRTSFRSPATTNDPRQPTGGPAGRWAHSVTVRIITPYRPTSPLVTALLRYHVIVPQTLGVRQRARCWSGPPMCTERPPPSIHGQTSVSVPQVTSTSVLQPRWAW